MANTRASLCCRYCVLRLQLPFGKAAVERCGCGSEWRSFMVISFLCMYALFLGCAGPCVVVGAFDHCGLHCISLSVGIRDLIMFCCVSAVVCCNSGFCVSTGHLECSSTIGFSVSTIGFVCCSCARVGPWLHGMELTRGLKF